MNPSNRFLPTRANLFETLTVLATMCVALLFSRAVDAAPAFLVSSTNTNQVLGYGGTGAFSGVFASGSGLTAPSGLTMGPGGDVFVSSTVTNDVKRFDGLSGAFEGVFASGGGLSDGRGIVFGPDGNLYVASANTDEVLRYSGVNGSFLGAFVTVGSGGLSGPIDIVFGGPQNNLFVVGSNNDQIFEYDEINGVPVGIFASGGGLTSPSGVAFGTGGDLYVSSTVTNDVKQFDGVTGTFEGVFASGGGLADGRGIVFGPDGHLYVASSNTHEVLKYNGASGAFLGAFVNAADGGLGGPMGIAFVPEPSTLVLAGISLVLLPLLHARMRKKGSRQRTNAALRRAA